MILGKNLITLNGCFEEIESYNSSFYRVKMKIFAFGLNNNNSDISEVAFEKAKPTIFNIPIVAMYTDSDDAYGLSGDLEGHNTIVDKDKNGDWVLRQDTYPIGVLASNANITYEQVNEGTESNPIMKTYVVADNIFLWKRYDATQKIQEWIENGITPRISMEINIKDGQFNENRVYEINDFDFLAVCCLGSKISPAFPMSSVEAYSKQEFQNSFFELLHELKTSIAHFEDESKDKKKKITIDNSKGVSVSGSWGDVDKTAFRNEITEASNASSLVKEAYLIVDDDWDEHPSEALHYPHHVVRDGKLVVHKEGVIAAYERLMQTDPNNKKALRHIKKHYKELGLDMKNFGNYSLSSEQLEDELKLILSKQTTRNDWGWEVQDNWFVDYLPDQSIVVAQDSDDGYLVGFPYTVDGDKVSIDMTVEKRYKVEYVPMDLPAQADPDDFPNAVISNDAMEYKLKAKEFEVRKEMESKINEYKQQFESMKDKFHQAESQVKELSEYQAMKVKEEREESEKAILDKYSQKLSDEDIEGLKAKAGQFSLDDLEKECLILVGQKALSGSFSLNGNKSLRVPVWGEEKKNKHDSLDDLIERYSDKN